MGLASDCEHGGELARPGALGLGDGGEARRVRLLRSLFGDEPVEDRLRRRLGVADDAHLEGPDAAELLVVDVDLHDLGALGEVVETVLRQRPEAAEAGAQRKDAVRLGEQAHGGLGALVADGSHGEFVGVGERVGVLVGVGDGRAELLSETTDDVGGAGLGDSEAGDDGGVLGRGQHLGGAVQRVFVAGAACRHPILVRLEDRVVSLRVEEVARHVDLHGAALRVRGADGRAERLGDAVGPIDLDLELGDRAEDRQLFDLLEAVQAAAPGHR